MNLYVIGAVALMCALILAIIIPNEVWSSLFYFAIVITVGYVGYWSGIIYLSSL